MALRVFSSAHGGEALDGSSVGLRTESSASLVVAIGSSPLFASSRRRRGPRKSIINWPIGAVTRIEIMQVWRTRRSMLGASRSLGDTY